MIRLARWLSEHVRSRPVCWRANVLVDGARFEDDVARLALLLSTRERGRWIVCTESAYACAVGLFALWQHGSIAVLPPNLEAGSLRELSAGARGVLADLDLPEAGAPVVPLFGHPADLAQDTRPIDRPAGLAPDARLIDRPAGLAPDARPVDRPLGVARVVPPRGHPAAAPASANSGAAAGTTAGTAAAPRWRELDPASVVVELCTSGSTGARKLVPKTLAQLESEIEALEREFGAGIAGSAVLGTVSFQHIYGLLFRVLWPLCAGRVFADQSVVDPAELERAFAALGRGVLVGSPAHLKRLPELADLARIAPRCAEVFSSGGALDEATALRFERELGRAPLEVLGSTETGGIAWRRQGASGGPAWTPFPGVEVEVRDGLLTVHSLPAGASGGIATGDAIELLPGGRFVLLGRADRIVKLFDERVSLPELESRLAAHPAVQECSALTLERGGTPRIAAAVVLSPAGAALLRESGKPAVVAALRAHLAEFLRAPALPRAWRFVERLPEDAQGKRSMSALSALFSPSDGASPDGAPSPLAATLCSRAEESESALELELEVPQDLWCMRGHFDGFPVVPGVVQLQWVLDWAAEWTAGRLGGELPVRGVEALKFKQILCGGVRFRLRLERTNDAGKLRFRLWNERGEFSSGRVLFAGGEA